MEILEKINPKRRDNIPYVQPHSFFNYFKKMLTTNTPNNTPPENREEGPLDYNITITELKKASKVLKPAKAVGKLRK